MYKRWATHSCKEEGEVTFEAIFRLNAALEKARDYYLSMGKVPYITSPMLTELNAIILPNNFRPGIRSSTVYTVYKGRTHIYPEHWTLEEQLHATCDMCNRLIRNLKQLKNDNKLTLQILSEVTALIVFNIISIHPYIDGNGRLCRVIAAYIFFLVTDKPKVIEAWTPSLVAIRESIPKSKTTFPVQVNVEPFQNLITKAHNKKVKKVKVH